MVLRFPRRDGDHVYRVAKMKSSAIQDLNDRISRGDHWYQAGVFGPPLDLAQAIREVNTRDFIVLEVRE